MSILLTFILYAADIAFIFHITNHSVKATLIASGIIIIAVLICMILSFLALRPKSVKKLRAADRRLVESALRELEISAELSNVSIPRIRTYWNSSDNVNAFAAGFNGIVLTRGLLQHCAYDSRMLAAVIAHEVGHICHMDMLFSAIVTVNILAVSGAVTITFFGASMLIVVIAVLLLSILLGDILTLYLTNALSKVLGFIVGLAKTVVESIAWVIAAIFMRIQEYAADRFAAACGFSFELIYFLESCPDESEQTFIEEIMSTHPSHYARIKKMENISMEDKQHYLLH